MKNPIIVTTGNSGILNKVVLALLISGGTALITWKVKKYLSNKEAGKVDEPDVQLASRIRTAVNPSGISWFIDTDFTDNEALFQIAKEISEQNNFSDVAKTYKKLYNETLESRLRSEFTASEYKTFFEIIAGKSTNTSTAWNQFSVFPENTNMKSSIGFDKPEHDCARLIMRSLLDNDFVKLVEAGKRMANLKVGSKTYGAYEKLFGKSMSDSLKLVFTEPEIKQFDNLWMNTKIDPNEKLDVKYAKSLNSAIRNSDYKWLMDIAFLLYTSKIASKAFITYKSIYNNQLSEDLKKKFTVDQIKAFDKKWITGK